VCTRPVVCTMCALNAGCDDLASNRGGYNPRESQHMRARSRQILQLVQSFTGSTGGIKINEMNDLDHRFSVAPMMDWSESSIFSIR